MFLTSFWAVPLRKKAKVFAGIECVETPRLLGQRISPGHLPHLQHMHRNAHVMATLGGVRSDHETRLLHDEKLVHWEDHGFGLWVFFDKESDRFVGRAGLHHVDVCNRIEIELLYALMPAFWNRGLATEMAQGVVEAASQLRLSQIVGFTLPRHRASRRVMEKVGFRYDRDFDHAGLRHVLYRLRLDA